MHHLDLFLIHEYIVKCEWIRMYAYEGTSLDWCIVNMALNRAM